MSRKTLIKSRINVTQKIKNDLSTCLNLFLNNKKQQQTAPFQTSIFNIDLKKEPVKYKKNLTDWRTVFSQRKIRKTSQRNQQSSSQARQQKKKEINNRPQTCSLIKRKKSISNFSFNKRPRTPGSQCGKVHSSFSQQNQKSYVSPFDPQLTPFVIVQNIYESNVNNLETQKRVQTARIKQYYQRKAEKVKSFRQLEKLETKINQNITYENVMIERKDFVKSGIKLVSKQKKITIYQRKSRCILNPNEYFRESNKVKIPQKFVIKQYPVEIKN